jgi:hypothetical protein
VLVGAVLGAAAPAPAAELELAFYGGKVAPFYEQSIVANLGGGSPVAGLTLEQVEPFELTATGGLTLAGGATLWLGAFGIEGRYDSADVDIEATGPVYRLTLRRPLPPASVVLSPSATLIDLQAVTPISLNLRLRTSGSVRFFLSGGLSYLPALNVDVRQELGVEVPPLPEFSLGALNLRATARPEDDGEGGRLGANLGAGLQFGLGGGFALVVDARAFAFKEQVLEWTVGPGSAGILPQEVLDAVAERLEPVRFTPAYFHLSGGLALRF